MTEERLSNERLNESRVVSAVKTIGIRFSKFIEVMKPYKEMAALVVAVILGLSAAVSWAVAHFATQSQLSRLECKFSLDLGKQARKMHERVYDEAIATRESQIAQLSKQGTAGKGASPSDQAALNTSLLSIFETINFLADETKQLKAQKKLEIEKFDSDASEVTAKCIVGATETPKK
jgi:hypothetical protein